MTVKTSGCGEFWLPRRLWRSRANCPGGVENTAYLVDISAVARAPGRGPGQAKRVGDPGSESSRRRVREHPDVVERVGGGAGELRVVQQRGDRGDGLRRDLSVQPGQMTQGERGGPP